LAADVNLRYRRFLASLNRVTTVSEQVHLIREE
jgi:hypothetical protein